MRGLPPPAAAAALQSGPGRRRPPAAPATTEDVREAGLAGAASDGTQVHGRSRFDIIIIIIIININNIMTHGS